MENKAQFIADINAALISNGAGRYHHLLEIPLTYVPIVNAETGAVVKEFVSHGAHMVNVTGDSLAAMLEDMIAAGVL